MPKELQTLKRLDDRLKRAERLFNTRLENYYDDLEKGILRQAAGYKKAKDFIIPTSKQMGIERLMKQYFIDIEKAASGFAKRELATLTDNPELIGKLSAKDYSKANKIYAQKLAKKQVEDFENSIKKDIDEALKLNPKLTTADIKDLIKERATVFKNTRLSTTVETEANRITNQVRLELYKKSGLVDKLKFTAVMDARTTQMCRSRHNTIFDINDPKIASNSPPLHVRCRSYWVTTKGKITDNDTINNIISANPIPDRLKIMPETK